MSENLNTLDLQNDIFCGSNNISAVSKGHIGGKLSILKNRPSEVRNLSKSLSRQFSDFQVWKITENLYR